MMTGFAFSLVTLRADLHNSGTSLIAAMAIFFKAPTWAPSFFLCPNCWLYVQDIPRLLGTTVAANATNAVKKATEKSRLALLL